MKHFFSGLLASILFSAIVSGQTIDEMQKYLHPNEQADNSTKQNILTFGNISVTLRLDKEGQICQAIFPSKSYSNNAITVGMSKVKSNEIKAILNILAPSDFRGKPIETWGIGEMGGRMAFIDYTYRNVIVKTYSALDFPNSSLNNSQGLQGEFELLDRLDEILNFDINAAPKENHFERSRNAEEMLDADVVTIKWINRQCVE